MKQASTFDAPRIELQPRTEYRVLSLHPEWAWAVFHAGKDVENRSWTTSHRGALLLHASGHRSSAEELAWKRQYIAATSGMSLDSVPEEFPRSAMLGIVELVDCVADARSRWAEDGHLHWLFRSPRQLVEPIGGIDGKMKVWRWTAPDPRNRGPSEPLSNDTSTPETKTIDRLSEDAVLAAFRSVATGSPENDVDLFRAVSKKLGFARMGARVESALRAHARRAVRKGVLARDGKRLRAAG